MRFSLLTVALALLVAGVPQAAAAPQSCIAVAPLALVCKYEIVMLDGSGVFDDDLADLQGFAGLSIAFYPKLLEYPGMYAEVPSIACTTTVKDGCDGVYLDVPDGRYQPGVYLLVAEVTGALGEGVLTPPAAIGVWGWSWYP